MQPALLEFPLFHRFADLWQGASVDIALLPFGKDDAIIGHGRPANGLWIVQQGWVQLSRHTPAGQMVTVELCGRGNIFGEAALFEGKDYPYDARALQADTHLVFLPGTKIRHMMHAHAGFSEFLMQLLGERLEEAQRKIEQQNVMSAPQRLGCFLLRLYKAQRAHNGQQITIPVEKHVVASYLGMKPETLSRSFQQLVAVGVSVEQQQVTVSDGAALREYVCSGCSEYGSCATEAALMAPAMQQHPCAQSRCATAEAKRCSV